MGAISDLLLRWMGWKMLGSVPADLKKYVIAVVPHTSNWDFPLGLLIRSAMRRKVYFIGKHTLFKPPFGWIFRSLGGYPVDRSQSTNYVDGVVEVFNKHESFAICIAPEGTRKKVDRLKTGFYYIAKKAGIPIILVSFDFPKKEIKFSEPFYPGDDVSADFEHIHGFFKGVEGFVAENSFSPAAK